MKVFKNIFGSATKVLTYLAGAGKVIAAGAAGATLLASSAMHSVQDKASAISRGNNKQNKHSEEGIMMKKSTFVALMVALATVAGVLGALYFYVLRREKELDEYEQLLFSEDFNDDFTEEDFEEPAEVIAEA